VLVVGDLNVDVVVVPEGPLHRGSDTSAAIRILGGGSAANTACWLAALGPHPPEVALLAARGDDPLGSGAAAALAAAGVVDLGPVRPGATTGTCVVLVDADGERTMLPDRGANDALDPAAVPAAFAVVPSWVHLSGYTLLHPGSRAAGRAVLAEAARLRLPTSVDAASAVPIVDVGPATVRQWMAGVGVVLANDDEVAALGGADRILEVAGTLVAKHGAGGATWTDGTAHHHVAAPCVPVVDTTGAGDAFAAGWIAASLAGADPAQALAAAVAAGSAAVGMVGGRPTDGGPGPAPRP
jgi:sugar/nucleoside kinase (ribokinase family)